MRLPGWYRAIFQPFRWAVAGALLLAAAGVVYGAFESIRYYPLSSWFAVIVYVGMLGALAGFLLGLIAGALRRLRA